MTVAPPGISHHTAEVNGIRVHYALAGDGPPVVLLHGFPETWYAWRHQIPALAGRYSLVVPDLRGYGDTAKPPTGYDKRTMAADVRELLRHLGHDRVALVGHDRGARVATRFAKDHRDVVDRLVVLDNVPTRVIFQTMDAEKAKLQWWFLFNQVPHLPEALIAGREGSGCGTASPTGATTRPRSPTRTSPSTPGPTPSRGPSGAPATTTGPAPRTSPRTARTPTSRSRPPR